jgi:hypothetical protein
MKLNWRSRRLGALAPALAVLAALAAGTVVVQTGLSRLEQARRDGAAVRARLAAAGDKLAAAERRGQMIEAAAHLVSGSRQFGLEPERWVERKVNLRAITVSRSEAELLMQETAPGPGRLFMAEAFEISVLDGHESLFDRPGPQTRGLSLTLRGAFFARDRE